jgi:hypothetical protein
MSVLLLLFFLFVQRVWLARWKDTLTNHPKYVFLAADSKFKGESGMIYVYMDLFYFLFVFYFYLPSPFLSFHSLLPIPFSDRLKYEKARCLIRHIDEIRNKYWAKIRGKDRKEQQLGIAVYVCLFNLFA